MPLAELLAKAESDFEERWKAGQARRLLLLDPASLEARACYVGGRLAWAAAELHGAFWYHA